jgi:Trk K+ transport system NAD-binding subunit
MNWRRLRRTLRASIRDTRLLLRQFRWPLGVFAAVLLVGGFSYYYLAWQAGFPISDPAAAIYQVLGMTFLQPVGEFPDIWYLEVYYFVMPVIGVMILAQGVTDFGVYLFNRRARAREWQMAVASTFSNHTVIVGLGHLGYRVVNQLHQLDQEMVVIELNPSADLLEAVRKLDVPVLVEDATREVTLEEAGIRKARALVLCIQNDSMNLQIAVKARSMNPNIHVIVRIFDEDFARALQQQFNFTALSATSMAAPAFAAAACGVDITPPIAVAGQALSLARLTVAPSSRLVGQTVGSLETQFDLSIVLIQNAQASDLHPAPERSLAEGDLLAMLGDAGAITRLVRENRR